MRADPPSPPLGGNEISPSHLAASLRERYRARQEALASRTCQYTNSFLSSSNLFIISSSSSSSSSLPPPSFNHGINYSFPLLVSSNKKGEKLKMGRKKRNDDDEARRFQMTFAGLIFRPFIGNKMIRTASAANRKSYCAVTLTKNVSLPSLEADCIAPLSV